MSLIDDAFTNVNRKDFLPPEAKAHAGIDAAITIGYGQTISQPTTVSWMLGWLDAQPGDKVLDVGSGSGWTTALLAHIVGPKGYVYGVEKVPELVRFGQENIEKAGTKNAKIFQAGEDLGLPEHAPFDRVLVSASARHLPPELINQLKTGGKMVIPVGNDILEITKTSGEDYEVITHQGFIFVPLV